MTPTQRELQRMKELEAEEKANEEAKKVPLCLCCEPGCIAHCCCLPTQASRKSDLHSQMESNHALKV